MLRVCEGIEQVLIAENSAAIIQRSRTFAIETSEVAGFGRTADILENQVHFPAVAEVVFVHQLSPFPTESLPCPRGITQLGITQLSAAAREPVQMAVGPAERGLHHVMQGAQSKRRGNPQPAPDRWFGVVDTGTQLEPL